MLQIKINGVQYAVPQNWHDITLKTYIDFLEIPNHQDIDFKNMPKNGKALNNIYDYVFSVINLFCGVPKKTLKKSNTSEVNALFILIDRALKSDFLYLYENGISEGNMYFVYNNEKYMLPEKHMQKSTIGELIISQLYQDACKELANGNYIALSKICAILCRKEGEWYEDFNIDERANMFLNLPMDILLYVGFFLQKLNIYYMKDIKIFMTQMAILNLKEYQKNMADI